MAAMRGQYLSYLLNPLPRPLRRRLHPAFSHKSASEDYVRLSRNYAGDLGALAAPDTPPNFTRLHRITATGMYIAQTPHDNEVYSQPSLVAGQSVSSPYHNMDVVEFAWACHCRSAWRWMGSACRFWKST